MKLILIIIAMSLQYMAQAHIYAVVANVVYQVFLPSSLAG
jgi:hypothetical protein